MPIVKRVINKLHYVFARTVNRIRVKRHSKHLSGPSHVKLDDAEVGLVCMVKDGGFYLDTLIKHHRRIGVRHFLFIDNGSVDGSMDHVAAQPDVTVISNHLSVTEYECLLRAQIARQVFSGGWFLFVDSDELAEMAHGTTRGINAYTEYCNEHGYDIVVGQVLELFSPHALSQTADWSYETCVSKFNRMSLREIEEFDYHDEENNGHSWFLRTNSISNHDIKIMYGGVRREVFGEYCGLTVHRLVKNSDSIGLYAHPHSSTNAHCADFTMLFRHYKFAGPFLARERRHVEQGVWIHGEDKQRLSVIGTEDFVITGREEQEFKGTEPLVANGFLACSDRFLEHFPPP